MASRTGTAVPGTRPMLKISPLAYFGVATIFVSYTAFQFSKVSATLTDRQAAVPAVAGDPQPDQTDPPPEPPRPAQKGKRPEFSVHKALIRCLSDLHDLLDTVHDPASFNAIKPKLLNRMHQQVALVAAHPDQGMVKMSKAAALEMQKAVNRHTEAMIRANEVAPGVSDFFAKDVAAIINGK